MSENNMVLDETTGLFVHQQSHSTEETDIREYSVSTDYILDEKTGLFVECSNEFDRLSESSDSFSLSSNQCSEEVNSDSDSHYMSKKLDENSGKMQRKRRTKGQGRPEKWEANKVKRARLNGKAY